MAEPVSREKKLDVFISYSRDDRESADNLEAALRLGGFETRMDRTGIHGGEKWEEKLGALIRDSDTIVFVLSPSSAASRLCAWEVDEAHRLGKRVIPVLCRALDGIEPPAALAALNYIYFFAEPKKAGTSYASGLHELAAALKTDLEWMRRHTRLLQRAIEWEASGRAESRLLFADSLAEAKAWSEIRPTDAPEPTALQYDYIRASEESEARRQSAERRQLEAMAAAQAERANALSEKDAALKQEAKQARRVVQRTMAGLAAALVLGLVAAYAAFSAEQQRRAAVAARNDAIESQRIAEGARSTAEERGREIALANKRLAADMKLRVAPFGTKAYAIPGHWYKLASTNAASIVFLEFDHDGKPFVFSTAFLIEGRDLYEPWGDTHLIVAARHTIDQNAMQDRNFYIRFPAIDPSVRIRLGQPRWRSAKPKERQFDDIFGIDIIIFALDGKPPEGARPVQSVSDLDIAQWPEVRVNDQRVEKSVINHDMPLIALGGTLDDLKDEGLRLDLTLSLANALGRQDLGTSKMVFTDSTTVGASGTPVFEANTGKLVSIVQYGTAPDARPGPGLDYSGGTTMHALRAAIRADPTSKGEPPDQAAGQSSSR